MEGQKSSHNVRKGQRDSPNEISTVSLVQALTRSIVGLDETSLNMSAIGAAESVLSTESKASQSVLKEKTFCPVNSLENAQSKLCQSKITKYNIVDNDERNMSCS